jgi:hypothetical protein
MPIITLIVVLAVIGVLLWLIDNYLPMDPTIKRIINVVIIVATVLWLLNVFGLLTGLATYRVGHLSLAPPVTEHSTLIT